MRLKRRWRIRPCLNRLRQVFWPYFKFRLGLKIWCPSNLWLFLFYCNSEHLPGKVGPLWECLDYRWFEQHAQRGTAWCTYRSVSIRQWHQGNNLKNLQLTCARLTCKKQTRTLWAKQDLILCWNLAIRCIKIVHGFSASKDWAACASDPNGKEDQPPVGLSWGWRAWKSTPSRPDRAINTILAFPWVRNCATLNVLQWDLGNYAVAYSLRIHLTFLWVYIDSLETSWNIVSQLPADAAKHVRPCATRKTNRAERQHRKV